MEYFVLSTPGSVEFEWPLRVLERFKERHGRELTVNDRYNNTDVLILLQELKSTRGKVIEILVVADAFKDGIDYINNVAFFNKSNYIVSKLRKIVQEITPSSYINQLERAIQEQMPYHTYQLMI